MYIYIYIYIYVYKYITKKQPSLLSQTQYIQPPLASVDASEKLTWDIFVCYFLVYSCFICNYHLLFIISILCSFSYCLSLRMTFVISFISIICFAILISFISIYYIICLLFLLHLFSLEADIGHVGCVGVCAEAQGYLWVRGGTPRTSDTVNHMNITVVIT